MRMDLRVYDFQGQDVVAMDRLDTGSAQVIDYSKRLVDMGTLGFQDCAVRSALLSYD